MDNETRKFQDYLKTYKSNKVNRIIGIIDTDIIFANNIYSLYYIFPLIEKLIVSIAIDKDIEFNNQGTYRTPLSIIEENKKLFSKDITNLIKKYYTNDGLRNKILHYCENGETVTYNKKEIYQLLFALLDILKDDKKNEKMFEDIKYIC